MMTHSFTDIQPEFDSEGRVSRLTFTAVASNGTYSAERSIHGSGSFPLPRELPDYSTLELEGFCDFIATQQNVYTTMECEVMNQGTPVYTPTPPPPEKTDAEKKAMWMAQIDNNVAIVYSQFTRFQMEYEQREKAAIAFKDAGYTGDPTIWLTAYADSAGIGYQVCAELVLQQAAQLRGAVTALGNLRMQKYKVQNAATLEEADTEFNTIIAAINTLARSL